MKITTTAKRLKEIMTVRGLKQVDIVRLAKPYCEKYGVRLERNDLSQYVNGKSEPNQEKLTILGLALGVSEPWLMGYDVPMKNENLPEGVNKGVPLVGQIAAGEPILAEQNIEDYFLIDESLHADFCLIVKGDSMVEEGIFDGDLAFIRQQPILENGEIGAVILGNEATLKRVYQDNGLIILQPANRNYKAMTIKSGTVTIAGKLVAVLNRRD